MELEFKKAETVEMAPVPGVSKKSVHAKNPSNISSRY
jgi:hypothetical protein